MALNMTHQTLKKAKWPLYLEVVNTKEKDVPAVIIPLNLPPLAPWVSMTQGRCVIMIPVRQGLAEMTWVCSAVAF